MARKPCPNLRVLVGGVVVQDHVDFLARRCVAVDGVEEADELLMPVALHVLPDDFTGQDVQRREQRGRPVPLVVVGHRCAAALLERQPRLGAVKRLDLGLLIETEHHRMGWRCNIQAHDVMQLLNEGRVLRQFEDAPAMGAEPVRGPDSLHSGDTEPHGLRHSPRCPVGGLVWRRRLGQPDHLGSLAGGDPRLARRPSLVAQQAVDARLRKSLLPAPDCCLRLPRRGHDGVRAESLGR